MRRFVREYACDVLAMGNAQVKAGNAKHPAQVLILRILHSCSRGMVSDTEAVYAIAKTDSEFGGEQWRVTLKWSEGHKGRYSTIIE